MPPKGQKSVPRLKPNTHKQNGVLRNIRQRNRFFDHDLSQSAGGVGYGYPFYDRLDKRRQVPDGDIHPREKADQGTDEVDNVPKALGLLRM